jgi:hypothetical protein
LIVGIDTKGHFATSAATARIPLCTGIHTHSATACGLMHGVNGLILSIQKRKGGNTAVKLLRHGSHLLTSTRDSRPLHAATLATTGTASTGTFDR